jgi:hypothetical protein
LVALAVKSGWAEGGVGLGAFAERVE